MKDVSEFEQLVEGNKVSYWSFSDEMSRYAFAVKYVKNKVVLDVACGTGYGTRYLFTKGAKQIVGADISQEALKIIESQPRQNGLHFLCCDATKLPFSNSSSDVVVSLETIEHLKDPKIFLTECKRVLKQGGLLILSTPNKEVVSPFFRKPLNRFHLQEFSPEELQKMTSQLFSNVDLYAQHHLRGSAKLKVQIRSLGGYILEKVLRSRARARKFGLLLFRRDYHPVEVPSVNEADNLLDQEGMPSPWTAESHLAPGCVVIVASEDKTSMKGA